MHRPAHPRDDLVIDRLGGLALVVVVSVAACSGGEAKDSAFCRDARTAVANLERGYATLAEATQGSGQTDLDSARAGYTAALDGVIEALQSPPEEIRQEAASTVEGLRQQSSTVGDVQAGIPPVPLPADRQVAAGRVDAYLQTTCESAGSLTPR